MSIRTTPIILPDGFEDILTRARLLNEKQRKVNLELSYVYQELENHRATLQEYLDRVCERDDWKKPIDALLDIAPDEDIQETLDLVREAIAFFTATETTINETADDRRFVISAPGYRAGPAGDH